MTVLLSSASNTNTSFDIVIFMKVLLFIVKMFDLGSAAARTATSVHLLINSVVDVCVGDLTFGVN